MSLLNRINVLCCMLTLTTFLYIIMYAMVLQTERSTLTYTPKFQATVGEHIMYNWTDHEVDSGVGDQFTFRTSCPNRARPPKHMYVVRHTERLDFLYKWWHKGKFVQWTKRAFDKDGKSVDVIAIWLNYWGPQGGVWCYVLCAKFTCLLCAM